MATTTAADTALLDHLRDARRHLLCAYVAVDEPHRDQIGDLINGIDQALDVATETEMTR